MVRLAVCLILLVLPTLAHAVITPTAQIRQISCYAEGGNYEGTEYESLEDSGESTNFSDFQDAVGETVLPSNSLGSGTGIQDSSIGSTTITATGSASANAESYDFDWFASADGTSEFDVTFQIDAAVDYTLSGMVAAFDNGSGFVELTTAGGSPIFFVEGIGETPFSHQGTLQPGLYRLSAAAEGSCYADGFFFDYAFAEYDVTFDVNVVTASSAARGFVMGVAPNPMRGTTTLDYALEQDGPVEIDVFDARGRLVRRLVRGTTEANNSVLWDGRDDRGGRVPRGIYFIQLRADDRVAHRKLTVMR